MPRPLEPDDVLQMQSVGDPQMSPDGSRVVYTVGMMDAEQDKTYSALWLVPTNGGEPRQLTRGTVRDGNPRWSPDGRFVAFTSDRGGGVVQLWLLPLAGGDPLQLTTLHHGAGTPVWSPDGSRIAFSARVTPQNRSKNAPRVARRLRTFVNGSGYIGDGFWHLFVVAVPGGTTRQITEGEWHHFSPAWSPDGRRLAFVTTRRAEWDLEWIWDIYTSDADSGDLRQLTHGTGVAQGPAWSPDGARIAYYDNGNPHTGSTEDHHLHIISAAGGAATNLSGHMDRGVWAWEPPAPANPPLWAPDSQSALAVLNFSANMRVYRFSMDGEATRVIAGTGDSGWPTMSANGLQLAFPWAGPDAPTEVWTCDRNGNAWRQLTRTNDALMGEIAVSAPERFAVAAEDGRQVESVLWLPPGATAADGPFPTLLHLHGGPHGATGEEYTTTQQILATHGLPSTRSTSGAAPATARRSRIRSSPTGARRSTRTAWRRSTT